MLSLDIWALPLADSVQVWSPDSSRNQGSRLSSQPEETCPRVLYHPGLEATTSVLFSPDLQCSCRPWFYPAGTLCHYTNSICQQSAADRPRATILASATSGLQPCCLAKQLLDGLRDGLLLAISTIFGINDHLCTCVCVCVYVYTCVIPAAGC